MYIYIPIYIYTHACICMHVHIYISLYIICMYVCMYVYIYIHTHTHTHVHRCNVSMTSSIELTIISSIHSIQLPVLMRAALRMARTLYMLYRCYSANYMYYTTCNGVLHVIWMFPIAHACGT